MTDKTLTSLDEQKQVKSVPNALLTTGWCDLHGPFKTLNGKCNCGRRD